MPYSCYLLPHAVQLIFAAVCSTVATYSHMPYKLYFFFMLGNVFGIPDGGAQ